MLLTTNGRRPPTLAPSQQTTKPVPVPAPQKGINAVDGLIGMNPEESVLQINLVPSTYGTRVRSGYREWVTDVGVDGVRTIVPFTGLSTANDKLFAMASDGIYDITSSGTSPAVSLAFVSVNTDSGYGIWSSYTTIGGHFALYTDHSNGYYRYPEGGPWVKTTALEVTGVDPALLDFVMIFKERVWFIKRNSSSAYYLPIGSIIGAATEFNFGNKFKHGGTLQALFNWTVDGGEGIDDYLVAVSSAGDVVVYKGTDPASVSTFSLHGQWFIGPPPIGRRIGGHLGGELMLLSAYGLIPMSQLVSGQLVQMEQAYLTRKVTPFVNQEMVASRLQRGWEVKLFSKENLLILATPKRDAFPYAQFAQSTNNQAWVIFRDIPYLNGEEWQGDFYFGALDSNVYTIEGNSDAVSLDELTSNQISWFCIQSFQEYGEPGRYHRGQYIRPVFLSETAPSCVVEVRYDYNISDTFGLPLPGGSVIGTLWDVGIWDISMWGGDFVVADDVQGAQGIGRAMSVAISGTSSAETVLIRYDLMFDTGGIM